jgi:hypothetical protein
MDAVAVVVDNFGLDINNHKDPADCSSAGSAKDQEQQVAEVEAGGNSRKQLVYGRQQDSSGSSKLQREVAKDAGDNLWQSSCNSGGAILWCG